MQQQNKKSLESLSWSCHLSGIFSVFIGILITIMNALNKDWTQVQAGLYIFATGYALVKISSKIAKILNSENIN